MRDGVARALKLLCGIAGEAVEVLAPTLDLVDQLLLALAGGTRVVQQAKAMQQQLAQSEAIIGCDAMGRVAGRLNLVWHGRDLPD